MGRGRPPKPGTAEEKAAARRQRVRNNVRALRERRKQEAAAGSAVTTDNSFRLEWVESDHGHISTEKDFKLKCLEAQDEASGENISEADTTVLTPTHAGALCLANRLNEAKIINPIKVDTKNAYALAMLATVREMFLPDAIYLPQDTTTTTIKPWDSKQLLWTPCAFWITSAFAKTSNDDTGLLKTTLLSIGILLKSLEHNNHSLRVAALDMYRRSLQGIRKTLDPIVQGRPDKPKDVIALYLACHAAAMFELVQNPDLSATMRHLRGVSQLICHLGDGGDDEAQSTAWLLLQDYRMVEMGLCLKFRYASHSSIARRKFEEANLDRRSSTDYSKPTRGRRSHNMLVDLTDIADDICATMVRFDHLKLGPTELHATADLRDCLEKLDEIWQRFPRLHSQLLERYGNAFISKNAKDDGDTESSYKFKTFDIGAAWCYNLMVQLYCLETSIEATTLLLRVELDLAMQTPTSDYQQSPASESTETELVDEFASIDRLHELRRLHRAICIQLSRCLSYFLQTDKGFTGQTLAIFPLDTAFNMLNTEMERLKADLKQAHLAQRRKEYVSMLWKDISSVRDAQVFVQKLQDRAKQFGLPPLYEAGP